MISMKKTFKSLLTLCVFGFSFMTSVFSAEAIDEISSDITETEIQVDETEVMTDDIIIDSAYLPDISYNFNENHFLYYDQLDNNNKAAYDAMKVWIEPTTEEFAVSLPDTVSYETASTDMSSWDEEQYNDFWNMIFSNIRFGKDALTFDYPELFWLDSGKIKITLSNVRTSYSIRTKMYTMKISEMKLQGNVKEEYTDVDTAKEFKQLVDDSVSAFEIQGDNRYQQVKYIHDYIAQTVSYNASAAYHDAVTGLFCEPYQIVCEGYSKSFKLLCDKADIPCIVVPGNINTETNTGHMWNYVMMEDNEWYGLDCTWDDTNSTSNPVKYTYFLKGSDNFGGSHTPDTEVYTTAFTYPELNTDDYVYNSTPPVTSVTTSAQTSVSTTETTLKQTSATNQETNQITTTVTTEPVTTKVTTTLPVTTTVAVTSATTASTTIVTTTVPVTTTVSDTTIISTTIPVTTTAPVTMTEPVPEHINGDYNLNGTIDIADLVALRKVILGINTMDGSFPFDDLNNDNIINVLDYIILSRKILGGT